MADVELSVVLPAINEREGLRQLLPRLKAALAALGISYEIVVVDGGSRDGTREAAEAGGARVLAQRERGFGNALREGFEAASGERILVMDADGSHPPEAIAALWGKRDEADLVAASRFCAGGATRQSRARYWLSRALNAATGLLLGLPLDDASSGFRLYRVEMVRGLPALPRDFSAQQIILAAVLGRGGRVAEVPFQYAPRIGGESKARVWRWLLSYALLLWRVPSVRLGRAGMRAGLAALGLAIATGLCGIKWGLPGPQRWRALPPSMRTPAAARGMAEAWRALYDEIERSHRDMKSEEPVTYLQGVETIAAGWTTSPAKLLNSCRSYLLQSEHPDEKKAFIILSRMRPWRLEFKPLYVQYGGGFIYPLGAWLAAAAELGLATLSPDPAYYLEHPAAMGRLYLLGRLFMLLFHAGAVGLVFSLAFRMGGWRAGIIGATLYALCPTVIENTHLIKPHAYATFWTLAAFDAFLSASRTGSLVRWGGCGVFAGIAAGSNLALSPLVALPLLALRRRECAGARRSALAGVALGGVVVAALNPYLIMAPGSFAWEMTVYAAYHFGATPHALLALARSAVHLLGPAFCAAGIIGGVVAFARGGERRLLSVAAALLFGAIWLRLASMTDAGALRLYLPILGMAAVLTGDFLSSLKPKPVAALVLAIVFADAGFRGTLSLARLAEGAGPHSTRARAADWIDRNIPAGASVGLLRYPAPSSAPPFRLDRYKLVLFEAKTWPVEKDRPEWIIVDENERRELDNAGQMGYDQNAAFVPVGARWLAAGENESFVDAGMFILRKRTPGP